MSKEVKRYVARDIREHTSTDAWSAPNVMKLVDARDYEALLAERDAILLQAQIWAGEAKTQKATVDEVGKILGGVPDWGPIAAGVEQLKKDAERYRWIRDAEELPFNLMKTEMMGATLDAAIDAALQGAQP